MKHKLSPWLIRFRFFDGYTYAIWLTETEGYDIPYMENNKYIFSRRIAPLRRLCEQHAHEWQKLHDDGCTVAPEYMLNSFETENFDGIALTAIDMYSDFVQNIFPPDKRTDDLIDDLIIYGTFKDDLKPFFKKHGRNSRKILTDWVHYATGLMINNAIYIK